MVGIPLPRPRPPGADNPTADTGTINPGSTGYDTLTARVKQIFGDKCTIPIEPEGIPDNNPYFNKYGMSRESFLTIFIEYMILAGFDPTLATEFCTGLYGIESHYGANPSLDRAANTGCTGSYCGPLQIDQTHYAQWYIKIGHYDPNIPDGYLNPTAQIKSVVTAAVYARGVLANAYPNGTWRSKTIDAFDYYMMHQQGPFIGYKDGKQWAGYQAYINRGPNMSPVNEMFGWKQYGEGTLYNGNSTIRQMINAQYKGFSEGAARGGSGDCGEFAVEFLAGDA